jgi:AcrR family transcriptional regulator
VDHIVAAARIGVGSFYALFDGKEDCFLAAYDRIVAEAREHLRAAIPATARQPEKIIAVLGALLELIAAEPLSARVALVEAQTAGKAGLARYEETLEGIVPELRRCREDSPVAAELPETLEVATLGGVAWFLQQRILLGPIAEAPELLTDLAEIVIEPYVGGEETGRLLAALATTG